LGPAWMGMEKSRPHQDSNPTANHCAEYATPAP